MRTVLALVAAAGCGRIGYDPIDPIETTWLDTPCNTAVKLADLEAASGASGLRLDAAATATGFVVASDPGYGYLKATGLAVDAANRVAVVQWLSPVVEVPAIRPFAIAAIGDDVLVGLDDEVGRRLALYPLDELGYPRGEPAFIDRRGFGHDFVAADPVAGRFVVLGEAGGETHAYVVGRDGTPVVAMAIPFPTDTEGAGASVLGAGYVLINGRPSQCDLVPVDADLTPIAAAQPIAMTCHNPSAVAAPGSRDVIAAWNCDNDQVWVIAGDLATTLPSYRSVFGDATMVASNPRLAVTRAGVWYAYQVAGGHLGRTLLAADGTSLPAVPAADVYQSSALAAYDLVSRGDQAFLFWLESAADDSLWTMRLCAP